MGLTYASVAGGARDSAVPFLKTEGADYVIALMGNPNVGKSTVFNALTGMNQHTGWFAFNKMQGTSGMRRPVSIYNSLLALQRSARVIAQCCERGIIEWVCLQC